MTNREAIAEGVEDHLYDRAVEDAETDISFWSEYLADDHDSECDCRTWARMQISDSRKLLMLLG